MSYYIPEAIKKTVAERSGFKCEYCRIPESFAHYSFHIEHIIAIQHGGLTKIENLAYACSICNWKKGPNLGTILEENGPIIRLFHPRTDNWFEHFSVSEGLLVPKTDTGKATIKLLDLNNPDSIIERREMAILGYYP
jgi:hypothetical protein